MAPAHARTFARRPANRGIFIMPSSKLSSRQEVEVSMPVTIAGGLLFLWALVHAILTRTVADFVRYPLWFAAPATILLYGALLWEWWKSRPRKVSGEAAWMALLAPPGFYLVGAAYYVVGVAIKDGYFTLQVLDLDRNGKIGLAVCVTLAAGLALFFFRLKLRSTYGVTEAAVGLVVAGSRVASDLDKLGSDPALYLTVLTAGVYLVVRGLDNVQQGLTKDPIAIMVLRRTWPGAAPPAAAPAAIAAADASALQTAAQPPHRTAA